LTHFHCLGVERRPVRFLLLAAWIQSRQQQEVSPGTKVFSGAFPILELGDEWMMIKVALWG
jgi:hypothetical protein